MQLPKWIAHRGASQVAPENTLPALQQAKALGATWVEFDVQLTADDVPVIFHDETLARTTNGNGVLCKKTYAALSQLDAGSWFDASFSGVQIPTLSEWLHGAATLGLGINCEIKVPADRAACAVDKVIAALKTYWPEHLPTPLLSSSTVSCVSALHAAQADGAYSIGWISDTWASDWEGILSENGCATWHVAHSVLTAERVARVRAAGYAVLAYTVNARALAETLFEMGVASVFTDDVTSFSKINF